MDLNIAADTVFTSDIGNHIKGYEVISYILKSVFRRTNGVDLPDTFDRPLPSS